MILREIPVQNKGERSLQGERGGRDRQTDSETIASAFIKMKQGLESHLDTMRRECKVLIY